MTQQGNETPKCCGDEAKLIYSVDRKNGLGWVNGYRCRHCSVMGEFSVDNMSLSNVCREEIPVSTDNLTATPVCCGKKMRRSAILHMERDTFKCDQCGGTFFRE